MWLTRVIVQVHEFYSDDECRVLDRKTGTTRIDMVLLFVAASKVMERLLNVIGLQVVGKM